MLIIMPTRKEYELISHHTFDVSAPTPLTETSLDVIQDRICQSLFGTWVELMLLDDVTVRVTIETTENTDKLSAIITHFIQKGTIHI